MANDIATLALAYKRATDALKLAEQAKAEASQALVEAMQAAEQERVETPAGKVSLCQGRRTVRVTCKALQAEIKLLQERAVRTGRAVESVGKPYVMIR